MIQHALVSARYIVHAADTICETDAADPYHDRGEHFFDKDPQVAPNNLLSALTILKALGMIFFGNFKIRMIRFPKVSLNQTNFNSLLDILDSKYEYKIMFSRINSSMDASFANLITISYIKLLSTTRDL